MNTEQETSRCKGLLDFVLESGGSVRLTNALSVATRKGLLSYLTVGEYLDGGFSAELELSKLPAVGRKTVRELNVLLIRAFPERSAIPEVAGADESVPEVEPEAYPELLSNLPERQLGVLAARYGLYGQPESTLEDVGRKLKVTRERIRQIEGQAMRTLRVRYSRQIRRYLAERETVLWSAASLDLGFVRREERLEAKQRISAMDQLAIDAAFGAFEPWLASVAKVSPGGWLAKGLEAAGLDQIRSRIQFLTDTNATPLPCPLAASRLGVEERALKVALRFGAGASEYLGYIVRTPIGSRRRRTVRLHRLMCANNPETSVSISSLKKQYHETFPDDKCSARDMRIVMSEAPHLFLNMYEEGWTTLSTCPGDTHVINGTDDDFEKSTDDKPTSQRENTVAGLLSGILQSRGPMLFDELRQRFVVLAGGAYSKSSVGPILILSERFVRLAPSVYGLREHLLQPEMLSSAVALLLAPKHLAIYCQARWASEPMSSYPLWTPAMEKAWAAWSQQSRHDSLFNSLLAVASIEEWNGSELERERWIRFRRSSGHYSLDDRIDVSIVETIPRLSELVACCLQARQRNGISWISVNRVCGQRVDDRHSYTMLALLISLGIIEPSDHWQRWHPFAPVAMNTVDHLKSMLERSPDRAWPKDALQLVHKIGSATSKRGWLKEEDFARLFGALPHSGQISDREPVVDDVVDLDSLIKQAQRQRALRNSGLLEE